MLGVLQRRRRRTSRSPVSARLDSLVEQVRATGLDVALEIEGAPRPLPAAVDLSAYRIVQEALTNTIKHAGREHARVRVRYGDDARARDPGRRPRRGSGGARTGSGLTGMRERAAMLGGTGRRRAPPAGGYVVSRAAPARGDR